LNISLVNIKQFTSRKELGYSIYLLGLIGLAIGLPLSKFLTGASQFLLAIAWLLCFSYKDYYTRLINRRSVVLFGSVLIIHALWLLNTSDLSYALRDMKVKVPILIIPLIIGTFPRIKYSVFRAILLIFVGSVTIASFISTAILFKIVAYHYTDIRQISIFISHIRFALLINIAIFTLFFFLIHHRSPRWVHAIYILLILWLVLFLVLLHSLTGLIVFAIVCFITCFIYTAKIKVMPLRKVILIALICFPAIPAIFLIQSVDKFYDIEKIDIAKLETLTKKGNPYNQNITNGYVENGRYVELNMCIVELREEWNNVSKVDFDTLDSKGNYVKHTLMRYLTSKGLKKDAEGVNALTTNDIQAIESGIANYLYLQEFNLYAQIYPVLWQIDVYRKSGNPSGHSVTQRFEYYKVAFAIIKDNFWFGVGTGDVQAAFNAQYDKMNSPLTKERRLRAHNQFITFLLTFGIIGFTAILLFWIFTIYNERKNINYLFVMFIILAYLSMLNEDTLETQAGVTFFAYFFFLFLSFDTKK